MPPTDFIVNKMLLTKGHELYSLMERMYPICRSITGNGVRETLKIIREQIPLEIKEIPTGTKVFDWEVPEEWNVTNAFIENNNGERVIDFHNPNLHVLNYSIPVNKTVSRKELEEHIFTLPDYPDWVPYRTSYHNRQWGFCLSHKQWLSMTDESYHVKIDSSLKPGSLTYGEFYLPGKTEEEVLFTCHICHPSLCNDNLSGIVLTTAIAKELQKQQRRYSYRFLFIPVTIGSITWLALNEPRTAKIKHGLVLTLLGDDTVFHYKRSRRGDAEIDQIMEYLIKNRDDKGVILDFSPYGYDERQFCSPGFNLPVGRLSRKPNGEFPEYHTSADNLNFVSPERMAESLQLLRDAVQIIESNRRYYNLNPKCEPQLGKRGLYKGVGGQSDQKDFQMALLWILNLSDGDYSLLDIAQRSKIDFHTIKTAAVELVKANLLSLSNPDNFHG